jgi:hypothetical protein
MTMTVRNLLSVLNHMPQDMPVDAGSITITEAGALRLVSENLEPTEISWDSESVRDEIVEIIETQDDEVVDAILTWIRKEVFSDSMVEMLHALTVTEGGLSAVEVAVAFIDVLDDLDLSALDMYLDQYFEDNPDLV